MSEPQLKANISSSNYFDFDKGVETLTMLGASTNINNFNLSLGIGSDTSYKIFLVIKKLKINRL